MTAVITDPLASIDVRRPDRDIAAAPTSAPETRPFALREARSVPAAEIPDYRYDPVRQVAVDAEGLPVAGKKGKEWTSYEGTHTDGDGGDNETWGWEEQ